MITQERAKNLEAQIQAQAKRLEKQSAALKLAREALADVMEWCICQDSNFYKPCEEALATIDAIGEVK